jgi:hypothetical protein
MRYRYIPLLLLGLCCLGMGQNKLPLSVRFYTQTSSNDTDSFSTAVTLLNGQRTTVDDIAAISERDVVAIYPFTAADGSGGCALKLDDHGTIALDSLSSAKRGTTLIATIDGTQVADILIDKRVSDGILTIPTGITVDQMKEMLKHYPVLGGKKKIKKNKDGYSQGF